MNIHVVLWQDTKNYHFDITGERVPQVGEMLAERTNVFVVENLMTYLKDNKAVPVVLVRRAEAVEDMPQLMEELEFEIKI